MGPALGGERCFGLKTSMAKELRRSSPRVRELHCVPRLLDTPGCAGRRNCNVKWTTYAPTRHSKVKGGSRTDDHSGAETLDETQRSLNRELLSSVTHRRLEYLNNQVENSHQPTRIRERVMKRFGSPGQAQWFLFAFGSIRQHFRPRRHLISASQWRHDHPLRGLARDHSRRSGMKETVSHYIPPQDPLTSTAPQAFSNSLTMTYGCGVGVGQVRGKSTG